MAAPGATAPGTRRASGTPAVRFLRERGADLAGVAVCLGYAAFALPLLTHLDYNYDEGFYIQQALLVLSGQRPYVDFFYHQPPLFPYTMALAGLAAPDSLWPYRLVSLVATLGSGLAVYAMARRLVPGVPAVVATILFYYPSLQRYDLLATPTALMLFFSTAGVYLVCFRERAGAAVAGTACLVVSVLYKPLSLGAVAAVGAALLATPAGRRKLPAVVAAGLGTGLLAWGAFHVSTDGLFTDVVRIQLERFQGQGGWEVMHSYGPFIAEAARRGVEDAFEWNVYEHLNALVYEPLGNQNFHLLALAAAGWGLLLSPLGRRSRDLRVLLSLWWIAPLGLSLFVWEPNWDHYYVQYLPAFALLAGIVLERVWRLPAVPLPQLAVIAVACVAATGPLYLRQRTTLYWERDVPEYEGQEWLTFDPFLNFISRTKPACGVIDVFNAYGPYSLLADSKVEVLARLHTSVDELIACIERNPKVRIGQGFWADWIIDEQLRAYIDGLPCWRFVPVRRRYLF